MESIWQDVRYALRGMGRQPWFTALAVLTLALGIGATTTMFSVIYNVLLDPFPYRAERVVVPQIRDAANANRQGGRFNFQTAEFLDFVEQSTVFEEVIAGGYEDVLYRTGDGTEMFTGAQVSGNTFTFLAVPAVVGRTLAPEDAKPGAPPVCVLAYKMWRKVFNEDAAVVGRSLVLNGVPTTVVGVMPPRFTKQSADLFQPLALDRADPRQAQRFYRFQARLKPGVTLAQAEAEFEAIARRLAMVYPRNYPEKFTVRVVSWVDNVVNQFKQTLLTLAAAVGLLLLIACGNVANMLLARAATRTREMALRAALGANRGRLIRQLLVESLLLAFAGTAVGCAFAHFGLKVLVAAIPVGAIPDEAVISLNPAVLLFSVAAAGVTALLFGLVPALQTAQRELMEPLKDAGKGSGAGFRGGRLRASLVVAEVALSLVLLAGAGLLMRSFINLQTLDLGFDPERVLAARLPFPRGQYQTAAEKQKYFAQLLPRLRALPGVEEVAAASSLPPYGGYGTDIEIPGQPPQVESRGVLLELCSEGYFQTLGLRLLRGRWLTETEVAAGRNVAVINQTLATKYFGGEDPIGRQIVVKRLANMDGRTASPAFEIIGVVSDIRNDSLERPTRAAVMLPYTITGGLDRQVLLRTAVDPRSLSNTVRREIWAVDGSVAVTDTDSLAGFLRQYTYARPRFSLLVLGVFAGVGLVLITVGVYSVMAYAVTRQTREIGIRMALGAAQGDVMRMVLRTGLGLVGLGTVIGLAASLAVTRVLTSQLHGVPPNDPLTLALVVLLIALTGLLACWIPARRATKVDPVIALRAE
jgi:putative ABC transport system permease protein